MSTTALTKTKKQDGVAVRTQLEFNDDQVALIKAMIAEKATDNELKMFLHQCQRTGLDPMTRQIYCIHRSGKMTIQTSIDGFRVIAERSGVYAGQDEPVFIYNDENLLIGAKVPVYKFDARGVRYLAAVGVAYWSEYVPSPGQDKMWIKMPHNMISKVAEALALRKAFPQDLSGLYTTEEMQQEGTPNEDTGFKYNVFMQRELEKLLNNSTYEKGSKTYTDIEAIIRIPDLSETRYSRVKIGLEANQRAGTSNYGEDIKFEEVA